MNAELQSAGRRKGEERADAFGLIVLIFDENSAEFCPRDSRGTQYQHVTCHVRPYRAWQAKWGLADQMGPGRPNAAWPGPIRPGSVPYMTPEPAL
jgi:hypothetical protein